MPPKKASSKHGLGRALMNHRAKTRAAEDERELHSTEVYDNKPVSVTEENDLDAFLNTATLAGASFTAERQNVTVINPSAPNQQNPYLLTPSEQRAVSAKHRAHASQLRVPRRPAWTSRTTPAELERQERDSFLEWRRGLAELTDQENLLLTPFERNLEVWRQLWRVLERSQLIVQIVDARNPLRFRCEDLETYVKEQDDLSHPEAAAASSSSPEHGAPSRRNLLLLNKADLLTYSQRAAWAQYFDSHNVQFAFFSAKAASEDPDPPTSKGAEPREVAEDEDGSTSDADGSINDLSDGSARDRSPTSAEEATTLPNAALSVSGEAGEPSESDDATRILTTAELEDLFLASAPPLETEGIDSPTGAKLTVGLVGYPNVGKSSTINALIGSKKVSVSATPGKTKHFQTINLSPTVTLCDCPGLVFPQFASTRAELVCDGVLPIDQMREYTGPAALVAERIPREVVEATYGIQIPIRPTEEGGTGVPTASELLSSYARARGFFTSGAGQPDESRAARIILKDYVNARLLFCHPPPLPGLTASGFNAESFQIQLETLAEEKPAQLSRAEAPVADTRSQRSPVAGETSTASALDQDFFGSAVANSRASVMGRRAQGLVGSDGSILSGRRTGAPVPSGKKHFKGRRSGARGRAAGGPA